LLGIAHAEHILARTSTPLHVSPKHNLKTVSACFVGSPASKIFGKHNVQAIVALQEGSDPTIAVQTVESQLSKPVETHVQRHEYAIDFNFRELASCTSPRFCSIA
jgi:hypothetical protein